MLFRKIVFVTSWLTYLCLSSDIYLFSKNSLEILARAARPCRAMGVDDVLGFERAMNINYEGKILKNLWETFAGIFVNFSESFSKFFAKYFAKNFL